MPKPRAASVCRATAVRFVVLCGLGAASLAGQQSQPVKLVGGDTAPGDQFGYRVAIDGDTAMVGALNRPLNGVPGVGAVYVFTRTNGVWSEWQTLIVADPAQDDLFGSCIALQGDTAVIGARSKDGPGGRDGAGAAYVFIRSGGIWDQVQKLEPADTRDNIFFGYSVALDGDTVVVGASSGRDASGATVGAAYFFDRIGGAFVEQQKLIGRGFLFTGRFGETVALDGDTAAIGAWGWPVAGQDRAGEVQVFVRNGGTWSFEQSLVSGGPAAIGMFGFDLSLDGDRLVVGAPGEAADGQPRAGRTWSFERSGGTWGASQVQSASDPSPSAGFGTSVALHGDTLIVGAPDALGSAGAGYELRLTGVVWSELVQLLPPDPGVSDQFGIGVDYDGSTAIVGAYLDNHGPGPAGSAYLFDAPAGGGSSADGARALAAFDADGDGHVDAITANELTDNLSLFLGDGIGGFGAPVVVPLTSADHGPVDVAAGDLDGDGLDDDVAVVCAGSGTCAIVLDVGSANRTLRSLPIGGHRPVGIAVGDLGLGHALIDEVAVALRGDPFAGGGGIALLDGGGSVFHALTQAGTSVLDVDIGVAPLLGSGGVPVLIELDPARVVVHDFGASQPTGVAYPLPPDLLPGSMAIDKSRPYSLVLVAGSVPSQGFRTRLARLDLGSQFAVIWLVHDLPGQLPLAVAAGPLVSGELISAFWRASVACPLPPALHLPTRGSIPLDSMPTALVAGDFDEDGEQDVAIAFASPGSLQTVLTSARGSVDRYGSGCAGTSGVPSFRWGGGTPGPGGIVVLTLSGARPYGAGLLAWSTAEANLPLGSGCTLWIGPDIALTALPLIDGSGAARTQIMIPNEASVVGLELFLQAAVFDSRGALGGQLALSNGVRLSVGW